MVSNYKMYTETTHSREVGLGTLVAAVWYAFLPPQQGYFAKLKERFGSNVLLYPNTESFLTTFLKHHEARVPGKIVAVEPRHAKRFGKIIERLGLKIEIFNGQKQLAGVLSNPRVMAIIISESYDISAKKYKQMYHATTATKIMYQNRKRPRSVALEHDVFVWEPKSMPRAVGGAVVVVDDDKLNDMRRFLRQHLAGLKRIPNKDLVSALKYARKGLENKYRRIDARPAQITARLLYNFYK